MTESELPVIRRCRDCGRSMYPPGIVCRHCGSSSLVSAASTGRGVVYATTAVHRRDAPPYNVCLVDLDDGVRLMTTVEGVPAEDVEIGMPVRVALGDVGRERAPVAVPSDA